MFLFFILWSGRKTSSVLGCPLELADVVLSMMSSDFDSLQQEPSSYPYSYFLQYDLIVNFHCGISIQEGATARYKRHLRGQ